MKHLKDNIQSRILALNQATLNQLNQKHPQGKAANFNVVLPDTSQEVHPITLERVDADMVTRAVVRTRGRARPSGMDADGWRSILTSKQFANSSVELYTAIS